MTPLTITCPPHSLAKERGTEFLCGGLIGNGKIRAMARRRGVGPGILKLREFLDNHGSYVEPKLRNSASWEFLSCDVDRFEYRTWVSAVCVLMMTRAPAQGARTCLGRLALTHAAAAGVIPWEHFHLLIVLIHGIGRYLLLNTVY